MAAPGRPDGYACSQQDITPFPEDRIRHNCIDEDYNIDIRNPLGDGANGNVYLCTHRTRGGEYAVKCLPHRHPTSRQEIDMTYHVGLHRPEFVTQLADVYVNSPTPGHVWPADNWNEACFIVVMERVQGQDLMNTLMDLGRGFTQAHASRYLGLCARAVLALHELNIAHRDLKPENFLLTSRDVETAGVKICDLGHAKVDENLMTERGTPRYVPPRTPQGYTKRCDEFSLGVCAYAMLSGRLPFKGSYDIRKEQEGFDLNTSSWRNVCDEAKKIVRGLLRWQEDDRMTVAALLKEPFIINGPPARPWEPVEIPPLTEGDLREQRDTLARILDVHRTNPPQIRTPPGAVQIEQYSVLQCIARGSYGSVFLAIDTRDPTGQTQIAVKEVRIQPVQPRADRAVRLLREMRLGKRLRHPNVVSLERVAWMPATYPQPNKAFLCMGRELIDLQRLVQNLKDSGQCLEASKIRVYTYQMLCALKYLHSGGVIHRDLKPGNILVSDGGDDIRICDLGFSRLVGRERQVHLTDYVTSRPYRAPEVIYDPQRYTASVDVWAVGCVMGYMVEGATLFHGASTLHQIVRIFELIGLPSDHDCANAFGERARQINAQFLALVRQPPAPELQEGENELMARLRHRYSSARPHQRLLNLMSQLLCFIPQQRPTAEDALGHPYFEAFDDQVPLHMVEDEPTMQDVHTAEELEALRQEADDEPDRIEALLERLAREAHCTLNLM